jgi:hypothetical protein
MQPRKGELVLSVGGPNSQTIRLLFDGTILTASVEEIRIEDKELREVWGEGIRRVLLKAGSVPARGESVIRIAAESVYVRGPLAHAVCPIPPTAGQEAGRGRGRPPHSDL